MSGKTELEQLLPLRGIDHVRGVASARVTLVEYGDYECAGCAEAYWIVCRLTEYVKIQALIAKPNPSLVATDREKSRRVREIILWICHCS